MNLLSLDHLAVCCETLPVGVAYAEDALGAKLDPGGEHAAMGTHNKLLGLGPDLYFETIAVNPKARGPNRPRWFNLDNFAGAPRLTNWILQTPSMKDALETLGSSFGTPMELERGDLKWIMAVPDTGILPWDGWAPALIEWRAGKHPAQRLPDSGLRLSSLRIRTPHAIAMAEQLGPLMPRDTALFEPAETPEMIATFQTPTGPRDLS